MMRVAVLIAPWLLAASAQAAPDPDWPCAQRLVPVLTASTYWTGTTAIRDWHTEPGVAALINAVAPRTVPPEAAVSKLQAYIAGVPPPDRAAAAAIVFAGLVDETNRQRDQALGRLRALTRRQREISQMVTHIALPADADPATREEVSQRRNFLTRDFLETERTIRYACEIPVQFEARLGTFGRALDAAQ